ncbi:hypothetical protein GPX89_07065 [Nocardia sp. ET3-3]|uniref:Uncharacterized protein n=1 Tax=Nocardia terrae TaxID=2675851 RepID=A0A7K1URN2_9NOCA|nr:hypothetical protein [Nocardia terrae]MVU77006.1 hypothetical protein [Nocardia terrae]
MFSLRRAVLRTAAPAFVLAAVTAAVGIGPASAASTPAPTDATATQYGSLGLWMLQSNGQIADWLGQQYQGKTMYEPIDVVFVDQTSTTAAAATTRLTDDLAAGGFPARFGHSTGYQGRIDGQLFAQQPADGGDSAFSDGSALETNDHGRVFGPAPLPGGGFVWTAAFSRESVGFFTHNYASFAQARADVRSGLLGSGATDLGTVALGNTANTATTTTGDHDGNAVVLGLQ